MSDTHTKIRRARWWIRYIARQKGNDRCWIDDHMLYWEVFGIEPDRAKLTREYCLEQCRYYFLQRTEVVPPATFTPVDDSDRDLDGLDEVELQAVWNELAAAIKEHQEIGDGKRIAADDLKLISVLPEKPSVDQTVPADLYDRCVLHIDAHLSDLFAVYTTRPAD